MPSPPLRTCLVGAGAMGRLHARVVAGNPLTNLEWVVDPAGERAAAVTSEFGGEAVDDFDKVADVDLVIIAAPTVAHVDIALAALSAGVTTFVEKPLAVDPAEVSRVVDVAVNTGTPLMCGFVERFNPVITTTKGLLDGEPIHLLAQRHSPANPAATSHVVYDLLIHDLDLVSQLSGGVQPRVVSALSWAPGDGAVPEITDAILRFPGGAIASLSASRWGQLKVRRWTVSTEQSLFELDLVRQSITIYRHVRHELSRGAYRADTLVEFPFIRHAGEPLALQLDHLVALALGEVDPDSEIRSLLPPHEAAGAVLAAEENGRDPNR